MISKHSSSDCKLARTVSLTPDLELPVKCLYVMADCSFSLALCTENKCSPTIYYVLLGYENLGIQLSDTSKSMVKVNLRDIHQRPVLQCDSNF